LSRVFIVGFGKVGRAILPLIKRRWNKDRVWVVEHDPTAFFRSERPYGLPVLTDGPQFLARYQDEIADEDWIIPALPSHLAWQWLRLNLKRDGTPRSLRPSLQLGEGLPFQMISGSGLLVSFADFVCPDHCPAPLRFCYKTRRKRPLPLWQWLEGRPVRRGTFQVIESRQLAPGMGGYPFGELRRALIRARQAGPPFFIATACRCHGVVNGLTW
jgi:hypothetical protein